MPSTKARIAVLGTLLVVTALSSRSLGQTDTNPVVNEAQVARARARAVPAMDVSVRGHVGGFTDTGDDGGVLVGGTALYRYGPIAAGGLFEGGGALFDYGYTGIAAVAGIGVRPARQVRVELLGSVGQHQYSGVGRGFMSDDPGVSGDSAYVGGRFGASYLFGSGATHMELGLYGSVDEDLSRETKRSRYTSTGWFSDTTTESESDHVIGTRRTSIVLALGMTHDVW